MAEKQLKKTASKKSTVKKEEKIEAVKEAVEVAAPVEVKVQQKKYDDEDLIQCRNITPGEQLFFGLKSGNMYRFVGQDDTYGVEVRDLNSFLASKHAILFKPSIVIEDEEFISQTKWKAIKEMYDATKLEDLDEMLNLSVNDFTNALISLPKGYKDLVSRVVSDRVQNGTFDSIGKIKAVDSICGTELMLLIK